MRQAAEESSTFDPGHGSGSSTLVALTRAALAGPERDLLYERGDDGEWAALTNAAVLARAEAIALGLRAAGLQAGDRVGLMSPNRVDWILTNLGILFAGCVTVPIYATQALDQVAYILADAGARALFVDTDEVAERLRGAGIAPDPIVFDAPAAEPRSLAAHVARGEAARHADPDALAKCTAAVVPDDLAILIYTSGTTGTPKGVMLSHRNVASNATTAFGLVRDSIAPGDPVLSILPFAHIYENTNMFGYFVNGARVYVTRRIEGLLEDLRSVRPVAVFAVPRIFERTYAGILGKARSTGGLRGKLIPWALGVGLQFKRAELRGEQPGSLLGLQFALAHALVLSKIRAQLGCDRLRYFVSGSAALQLDIALTFAAADILIMEGYGLTECSPVVTVNQPKSYKLGSVGRPIPNVEVRLADDGEVLVRGPNVMMGYYHRPGETAETIQDGWLGTGDVGTIDDDGYLRIVDRKKEIFKTSGGKYVSPARIEGAIARSPYIAQVVVFGSDRPHPAALVVPNWALLRDELHLDPHASPDDLARSADVYAFLTRECARETDSLGSHEQIRWIGVLSHELTIEAGELTPTLKAKRRVVETRYSTLVREFA